MTFRKIIFWCHLVAGVLSGLSIGIMCFTGTALAFEKELIAWAERAARRVEPPAAEAPRLSLDELQQRFRVAKPDARPTSIVVHRDPHIAVGFSAGRTGNFYANPYTGEIREPGSTGMGRFMQEMLEWHRYLNFAGEVSRPRGKLVNGICNVAFCVLALTGLYLWMPRSWSLRALRPVVWFTPNSSGKARDFNWHNVIGLWSAPILIVLTLTAMPISFRWAGNLIFTLTGTPPPAGGTAAGPGITPTVEMPAPEPGARALPAGALLEIAQQQMPAWQTITLRTGAAGGRGGAAAGGTRTNGGESGARTRGEGSARSQPVTFTVREAGSWPRTATTTLTLNSFTGEVLRRTGYAEQNAAQRVRSWTRFLHTGEAVGGVGQFLAGLASLGGCVLVYTGFALAWRRFFSRRVETDAHA